MAVKWVEDIDSGELFPVVDDENFDIPEHLKDADYNEVNYDRTIKYLIEYVLTDFCGLAERYAAHGIEGCFGCTGSEIENSMYFVQNDEIHQ